MEFSFRESGVLQCDIRIGELAVELRPSCSSVPSSQMPFSVIRSRFDCSRCVATEPSLEEISETSSSDLALSFLSLSACANVTSLNRIKAAAASWMLGVLDFFACLCDLLVFISVESGSCADLGFSTAFGVGIAEEPSPTLITSSLCVFRVTGIDSFS